jgi:predicted transcriptional regulator
MTTAVMKYEALTEILVPLAERFEAGDVHGLRLDASRIETAQPLRECVDELLAEGWLTQGLVRNHYRLTEEGYRHFGPRLHALRTLGDFGTARFDSAPIQDSRGVTG